MDEVSEEHHHHHHHHKPTHEEIAVAAYYIWEKETQASDYVPEMGEQMAVPNWLVAEKQLEHHHHHDDDDDDNEE